MAERNTTIRHDFAAGVSLLPVIFYPLFAHETFCVIISNQISQISNLYAIIIICLLCFLIIKLHIHTVFSNCKLVWFFNQHLYVSWLLRTESFWKDESFYLEDKVQNSNTLSASLWSDERLCGKTGLPDGVGR